MAGGLPAAGTTVEVEKFPTAWYTATVKQTRYVHAQALCARVSPDDAPVSCREVDGRVLVHYEGWSSRWDEWVPVAKTKAGAASKPAQPSVAILRSRAEIAAERRRSQLSGSGTEPDAAATKIQARVRGRKARREVPKARRAPLCMAPATSMPRVVEGLRSEVTELRVLNQQREPP